MTYLADLGFLTAEQQAAFAKINALFNLGPNECTFSAESVAEAMQAQSASMASMAGEASPSRPAGLILSSDPAISHVPPHIVPVGSIAELRKVAGYDDIHPKTDARPEEEQHYPAPLSAEDKAVLDSQPTAMKPAVSPELQKRIEKAAAAYVMLNPDRVREYEPLINATMFPGRVAVFAAPNLDVPPNAVYTINGNGTPVFLNFGTVTVGAGGSIAVDADCTFSCQTFTQQ